MMNEHHFSENKGDILIVDDDRASLQALSALLTDRGYDVRSAPDGPTALMIAQEEPPDLILLDILTPGMDGYEACRQLKSRPKTCHIPVIFLSALDDVVDKVKGFELGAVDYITKPFSVELIEAIRQVHRGEPPLHPEIARLMLADFGQSSPEDKRTPKPLTERELEVLALEAGADAGLVKGWPSQELLGAIRALSSEQGGQVRSGTESDASQ